MSIGPFNVEILPVPQKTRNSEELFLSNALKKFICALPFSYQEALVFVFFTQCSFRHFVRLLVFLFQILVYLFLIPFSCALVLTCFYRIQRRALAFTKTKTAQKKKTLCKKQSNISGEK